MGLMLWCLKRVYILYSDGHLCHTATPYIAPACQLRPNFVLSAYGATGLPSSNGNRLRVCQAGLSMKECVLLLARRSIQHETAICDLSQHTVAS